MLIEEIPNTKSEAEKIEIRPSKYSYRTPPNKQQRLEDEVSKSYLN